MEVFDWIFRLYAFTFVDETDRTQLYVQWASDLGVRPLQCADAGGKLLRVVATGCEKQLSGVDLNVEMDICVGLRCPDPGTVEGMGYDYSRIVPLPEGCVLSIASGGVSLGGFGFGTVVMMVVVAWMV